MVETAEANPSAGLIGSYQTSGARVRWQGFPYPQALMDGRDLCKQMLLSEDRAFGFGSPTSLMYRADLVRKTATFYPNSSPHADTSACYECLKDSDFAFVYQILCWERLHAETASSKSAKINEVALACLHDTIEYGKFYLSPEEYKRRLKEDLDAYYQFLAVNMLRSRGKEFWDYHRRRLAEMGCPMKTSTLLRAATVKTFKEIINPEQAFRKLRSRVGPAPTPASPPTPRGKGSTSSVRQ
jgi:hypothetical protein